MPIITELGIYTAELCEDSKKYLSQLLADRIVIGASIKNPDFLSWEELLRTATSLEEGEDLAEYLNHWIKNLHPEWDGKNKDTLKQAIINKLNQLETQYLSERLKPYDPEVRKQQADVRFKKHALIYLAIIAALTIALPIALGITTFFGTISLAVGIGILLLYSGFAFVGERLIDPEWIAEYSREKKWQKKISEMTTKTEIMIEEAEEPIGNKTIAIQQTEQMSLNKASSPLRVAATQTDEHIDKPLVVGRISFYKAEKPAFDSKHLPIVSQCSTSYIV